jgi:hypothetical protein
MRSSLRGYVSCLTLHITRPDPYSHPVCMCASVYSPLFPYLSRDVTSPRAVAAAEVPCHGHVLCLHV